MEDSAVFVGQHDGTAERIESFGHPGALDGADIEHPADRDCATQMRQQQLSKLDLTLRDDALLFAPADTETGVMHWRVHQEELHYVDHAGRLYELLKMWRRFDIRRGEVAREHQRLVEQGQGRERLAQCGIDLRKML